MTYPAPIDTGRRVPIIDSMRGLAILGILMINISYYAWPKVRNWGIYPLTYAGPLDALADQLLYFLAKGKFYTIFSFLFGLGMAVQKERLQEKGRAFTPFFLSRMFWLAVIGMIHGLVIWHGDVLTLYALVGLLLLFFQNLKPKWILLACGALLAWLLYSYGGNVFADLAKEATPGGMGAQLERWGNGTTWVIGMYDEALKVYSEGSWWTVAQYRYGEYMGLIQSLTGWWADLFLSFLLGVWCWRKRVFTDIARHRALLFRVLLWGGLLGLFCSGVSTGIRSLHLAGSPSSIAMFCWFVSKFTLGYAYLAGMALLFEAGRLRGLFDSLAAVGRMALTNYIMHSVVFTFMFNGYGLGLMGQVGESVTFVLVMVMFGMQIPLSKWWLARYRFGPCEWLWRSLTYRSVQPMRRLSV